MKNASVIGKQSVSASEAASENELIAIASGKLP